MSGASGSGGLGLFYRVAKGEGEYTVVESLGTFRLCRRTPEGDMKRVIAEFLSEKHARLMCLFCSESGEPWVE